MRILPAGSGRSDAVRIATVVLACALGLALAPRSAPAQESPSPCMDPSCSGEKALGLLEAGHAAGAVDALKESLKTWPGDPGLRRLLGIAYLKAGNGIWALRTLESLVAERPDDCEVRAWLARAHLERASLEGLDAALDAPGCGDAGPVSTRLDLVRAQSEALRQRSALDALRSARQRPSAWPEDRPATDFP